MQVPRKPLLFTVRGLVLPNSAVEVREGDPMSIAAALGYVTHVLYLLSLYLFLPLPYPVQAHLSTSVIRDDIAMMAMISPGQAHQRLFPLYPKGTVPFRFDYAVFLLNKDVEFLMSRQDLKVLDLRHTLPNLKYLLYVLSSTGPDEGRDHRKGAGDNNKASSGSLSLNVPQVRISTKDESKRSFMRGNDSSSYPSPPSSSSTVSFTRNRDAILSSRTVENDAHNEDDNDGILTNNDDNADNDEMVAHHDNNDTMTNHLDGQPSKAKGTITNHNTLPVKNHTLSETDPLPPLPLPPRKPQEPKQEDAIHQPLTFSFRSRASKGSGMAGRNGSVSKADLR